MKKTSFIPYLFFLFSIIIIGGIASCDDDDDDNPINSNDGRADIMVKLTDAPSDYDSVMIHVLGVRVKMDSENAEEENWNNDDWEMEGWINLLDFTNGRDTVILNADVPEGTVKEIRLLLDEDNYVVEDGVRKDLKVPSGSSSGLKVKLNSPVVAETDYVFILDFDVDKSIVEAGNSGNIILKPVIRGFAEPVSGSFDGTFVPADTVEYAFTVIPPIDTVKVFPEDNGYFKFVGLPSGTYAMFFKIVDNPELAKREELISVSAGETTNLGSIVIE